MRTSPSRRRTVGRLLVAVVVAVALLGGCGDDDTPVTADDTGNDTTSPSKFPAVRTEYRSVGVTEAGQPRALVPGTTISLHVGDDGSIGASLGCNSMGGRFGLDGDVLVLRDGLSMTEMGCDPELHAQDEWFADLLASQPRFVIEGDTLTIATDSTAVVLRERSVVDPDRPLEGTTWTVDGFLDGDVAMSLGVDVAGTIRFDAASSEATGRDGCVTFVVPYERDGADVRFGTPGFGDPSTADPVGDDADCGGEYPARFRRIFVERVAAEVEADRLTLLDPTSGQGVTFVAAQ